MTSIRVKFRPSHRVDGEGSIFYQVVHRRSVRQVASVYRIRGSEWNEKLSTVVPDCLGQRQLLLLAMRDGIRNDVERFGRVLRQLNASGMDYTVDDIVSTYNNYSQRCSMFNYMQRLILNLKDTGHRRTSETYEATLRSFSNFLATIGMRNENFMLDNLDSKIMEEYVAWQRSRGNSLNTISFYARVLRAVYNHAVADRLIDNNYPFRRIYTGNEKTAKRALSLAMIRKIRQCDLSLKPQLAYARDIFIMSFMLRGISFIDMAFLRKSNLSAGYLTYHRSKTGQRLTIKWTCAMQQILERYSPVDGPYLLPLISPGESDQRIAYRNCAYKINSRLKSLGRMLGIDIPLTMYVARHSWATAARSKGVPLSVISEGMGHNSEKTTRIYLAALDTGKVDRANARILSAL